MTHDKAETMDIHESNILVVDDTPVNLRVLTEMLKRYGFTVYSASGGPPALDIVKTTPLDLILLDIKMPEMDGYTVCEKIKADPLNDDLPVIFISALTDIDDLVKAFDAGGVDYITKPFKFREVLVRVETHLTLRRQRHKIEELREKDRQYFDSLTDLREQFIRAATHDLKNPLASVVGYTSLLEAHAPVDNDETVQNAIKGIRYGSHKMRQLVTDMLDLLQMESGIQLFLMTVSINKFLQDNLQDFQVVAQEKQIDLSLDLLSEDIQIEIDERWMGRVVGNLVSNAIKYTPNQGRVEVAVRKRGETLEIQIRDTGLGIPKKDLDNIFTAFFRVREKLHMQVEGTGLGLSIVRAIIEQHSGQIHVDSILGKGSVFTVSLPIEKV